MNFVKSGVYLAEITATGIKEQEISTRDPKEKEEEERLKRLPEFSKDPNFRSLAEQLEANELQAEAEQSATSGEPTYLYIPPAVTEEEAEFLEELNRTKASRVREEEKELELFRQSQARIVQQTIATTSASHSNIDDENEQQREKAPETSGSLGRQDGPRVLISVKGKRPADPMAREGGNSKTYIKADKDGNICNTRQRPAGLIEGYDDDDDNDD